MSRRRDTALTVASLCFLLAGAPSIASAQQAASSSAATSEPSQATPEASRATPEASQVTPDPSPATPEASPAADAPPQTATPTASRVRVAVVLVGDPSTEARAAADAIESAVGSDLELPADAALRASLLGVTGDDAIAPVVRDRRALGGTEAEDVPLLVALGDRADASLLLVVRRRAGHRELVGFDVRHGAFFDGALLLDGPVDAARARRFSIARARATQGEPSTEESAELAASAERAVADGVRPGGTSSPGGSQEEDEPEWIELNWPYLLAGALLAGAAAFVIVYTAEDGAQPVPTLRFRPGGTP